MVGPQPAIAVLLAYLMVPGAGELTESVIHLIDTGHIAHALDDEAHDFDGDEHGCSGPFHLCACHASVPFDVRNRQPAVAAPNLLDEPLPWELDDARADGYRTGVFRPPIA
jgi:hypothetical protein